MIKGKVNKSNSCNILHALSYVVFSKNIPSERFLIPKMPNVYSLKKN